MASGVRKHRKRNHALSRNALAVVRAEALEPREMLTVTLNDVFVANAYQTILSRDVEPAALEFWSSVADKYGQTVLIQDLVNSTEHRDEQVANLYSGILGRGAGQSEIDYWAGLLQSGAKFEDVESRMIGSGEFFKNAGATNASFVNAVYGVVLGRASDPQGANSWLTQLASGTTRTSIAEDIVTSHEGLQDAVIQLYGSIVGTAPQFSQLDSYVEMARRADPNVEAIEAGVFLSPSQEQFLSNAWQKVVQVAKQSGTDVASAANQALHALEKQAGIDTQANMQVTADSMVEEAPQGSTTPITHTITVENTGESNSTLNVSFQLYSNPLEPAIVSSLPADFSLAAGESKTVAITIDPSKASLEGTPFAGFPLTIKDQLEVVGTSSNPKDVIKPVQIPISLTTFPPPGQPLGAFSGKFDVQFVSPTTGSPLDASGVISKVTLVRKSDNTLSGQDLTGTFQVFDQADVPQTVQVTGSLSTTPGTNSDGFGVHGSLTLNVPATGILQAHQDVIKFRANLVGGDLVGETVNQNGGKAGNFNLSHLLTP